MSDPMALNTPIPPAGAKISRTEAEKTAATSAPATSTAPTSAADRAKAALAAKAKRAALRRAATPPRRRYPIGELREVALRRGREIVERSGVNALTLRGLARDLGVSAPALLYYFRTRDGMRAAVAERVQEELAKMTVRPMAAEPRVGLGDTGEAWITFAEKHANLYRLAFGEGWRSPGQGWSSAWMALPLPTKRLERTVLHGLAIVQSPAPVPLDQLAPLAHQVSVGIHGLAMARADGASRYVVRDALALLLATVPAGAQGPPTGATG